MWINKVKVHHIYLKDFKCHCYTVYSQCGRFCKTFYNDHIAAMEYAMKEYESRKEHQEFLERLDRI